MKQDIFLKLEKYEKITTKELNNLGINAYYINKLINQGQLDRINRGIYLVRKNESTKYFSRNDRIKIAEDFGNLLKSNANQQIIILLEDYLTKENLNQYHDLIISYLDLPMKNRKKYIKKFILKLNEDNLRLWAQEILKIFLACLNTNDLLVANKYYKTLSLFIDLGYLNKTKEELQNLMDLKNENLYSFDYLSFKNLGPEKYYQNLMDYLNITNKLVYQNLIKYLLQCSIYNKKKYDYIDELLKGKTNLKELADKLIKIYYQCLNDITNINSLRAARNWLKCIIEIIDIGQMKISKDKLINDLNSVFNDYCQYKKNKFRNTQREKQNLEYIKEIQTDYDQIIDYYNNSNESIDDICKLFSLNNIQTMFFMIFLAQEFYKNNFSKCGDELLKKVVQMENKPTEILTLLNETFKSKKILCAKDPKITLKRVILK